LDASQSPEKRESGKAATKALLGTLIVEAIEGVVVGTIEKELGETQGELGRLGAEGPVISRSVTSFGAAQGT
jgi:hypothetical protein